MDIPQHCFDIRTKSLMTPKRNVRMHDHQCLTQERGESSTMASSSTSSSTSSRTSRTSSYEDMHAAMIQGPISRVRDATEKELLGYEMQPATRSGHAHAGHTGEQHKLPSNLGISGPARLTNFGIVSPGVYRSSYPLTEHFEFCQSLGLKTVVTLVNKDDERSVNLGAFVQSNGIRHVIFNMQGTKKEDIPQQTMQSILGVVLDKSCYPVLIHCNQGRHRTGCVVAAARKVAGWSVDSALEEYRSFAEPKVRECDVQYITALEVASLEVRFAGSFRPAWSRTRFTPARRRHFIRFVAFTVGTMALFLCSSWRYPWV